MRKCRLLALSSILRPQTEGSLAEGPIEPYLVDLEEVFAVAGRYDVDFSDVRGQESAKRALTIAAACRELAERRVTTTS